MLQNFLADGGLSSKLPRIKQTIEKVTSHWPASTSSNILPIKTNGRNGPKKIFRKKEPTFTTIVSYARVLHNLLTQLGDGNILHINRIQQIKGILGHIYYSLLCSFLKVPLNFYFPWPESRFYVHTVPNWQIFCQFIKFKQAPKEANQVVRVLTFQSLKK